MKLNDLLKNLKYNLHIDDKLKAYLYDDRIEIIDYTSEYVLADGYKVDACYGYMLNLYIKNNTITMFEDKAFKLVTTANKDTLTYLISLIGLEIEDYDNYNKLPKLENLDCITI